MNLPESRLKEDGVSGPTAIRCCHRTVRRAESGTQRVGLRYTSCTYARWRYALSGLSERSRASDCEALRPVVHTRSRGGRFRPPGAAEIRGVAWHSP
jgi:hypothetical protein